MVLFLLAFEVIKLGNFFDIRIKNLKKIEKDIKKMSHAPEIVSKRVVNDFKGRAPGWIAKEVCAVYNIKQGEVKPSQQGSVGSSIGNIDVRGKTISSVTLVYRGRLLTPTHFNMTPKEPPHTRNSGYTIKVSIKKKQRKTLGKVRKLNKKQKKNIGKNFTKQGEQNSPKSPIMLLHTGNKKGSGTNYIPFQRVSQQRNDLKAIKTISMPQMISNPVVKERIDDRLSVEMQKRLNNHMNKYMK